MEEQNSLDATTSAAPNTTSTATARTDRAAGGAWTLDAQGALPDDAPFPTEIAALYLRMTPAEFADLKKPKRTDGRTNDGAPALVRFDKTAKAQTQPSAIKLGELRELGKNLAVGSTFDAASKAGLSAWISAKLPFFAELEPRVKRGRRVLIGNAWDMADPKRELRFADLLSGRIRFTWLTSAEASVSLWSDEPSHRAFTVRGLALLEAEAKTIEAALAATAVL